MMRVITGSARGARLRTLEGEHTRPTTERVKEAIFSMIQFDVEGRAVLDLFAGSGQMGIEALSRGAHHAVFVENDSSAAAIVKQNLQIARVGDKSTLLQRDALDFCRRPSGKFDIVFIDPPYAAGMAAAVLPALPELLNRGAIVICETAPETELPETIGELTLARDKRYGRSRVRVYRREVEE